MTVEQILTEKKIISQCFDQIIRKKSEIFIGLFVSKFDENTDLIQDCHGFAILSGFEAEYEFFSFFLEKAQNAVYLGKGGQIVLR